MHPHIAEEQSRLRMQALWAEAEAHRRRGTVGRREARVRRFTFGWARRWTTAAPLTRLEAGR
jgi:hypothetical protein